MKEIMCSFDVCLSVCVSVHSRPVNQTGLKRLKLRTSNLTCLFPATSSAHDALKYFRKGAWPESRDSDPVNFWALNPNSSKAVTVTDFEFGVRVSRDSPDTTH